MTVVTRIAPSPTGSMHIGTARTALFNYLYARRHGGKFLVRVEDTDRERSTKEAVDVIFDSMKWLGLEFDGEPVFQSERAARHVEVVHELLARGHAYYDFMSEDETKAWKEANKGKAFRSMFRDMPGPAPGMTRTIISSTPAVVRFKGPTTGETVINDLIKGEVRFQNENLDDLVLLRSDGTPTYNLAVVVDDHDMGITHVIRGDDHMNNAGRQALIYKAMGWDLPEFAHVPLIMNPEGKKLSKRDGDLSVLDMAAMGYLPEAMLNYLARLGWGHGNDEIFFLSQAVEWFDVRDVVSAPARLDWKKLDHLNNHYLRRKTAGELADLVVADLDRRGLSYPSHRRVLVAATGHVEGATTVEKLADSIAYALRPISYDDKASAILRDPASKGILTGVLPLLVDKKDWWTIHDLNQVFRPFAEAAGYKMKDVGSALRSALTGTTVAPDLGTILTSVGYDESIARIRAAMEY